MKDIIKILNENIILYDIVDNKIYLEHGKLFLRSLNIKGVLDVSMIENLKYLYCSNNKITKIICNENLLELYCYNNNITKIICSNKISYMLSYNNPIYELEISDNNFNIDNCYMYSDIFKYFNEFYLSYYKLFKIEYYSNKYIFNIFKIKLKENVLVYTYHNITFNEKTKLYKFLNGKYN